MTLARRITLPALLLLSAAGLAACTIEFVDQDHSHELGPGVCGDGAVDDDEVCDDGNTTSGDGCSALCDSTEPCGDGIVTVALGEVCDDGNHVAGDGCSPDCRSTETCGDGIVTVALGEVCDDGNHLSGDGCSPDCRSAETCGNGITDPGEQCDAGFLATALCDLDCTVVLCGDGLVNVVAGEQCDDGNTIDGDGCRNTCTLP